jgi:hypothetical protein
MTMLIFDGSGEYDTFLVSSVEADVVHVDRPGGGRPFAPYQAHTTSAVEVSHVAYALKLDPSAEAFQLVTRRGAAGSEVPVVDHVVALSFEYFGDPAPPVLTRPLSYPVGPWTTYGPAPPLPSQPAPNGFPAGENCTFAADPITSAPAPRLAVLTGGADGLVQLTNAQLTDGPWCPSGAAPDRWDADLLRVRRVRVAVTVESANAALRGPAGILFARGGTSTRADKWLPDRRITFDVTPRNMGR